MSNDPTLALGATGKTGRRVVARLRLRGTPVRAASRSSSTRFDWSDPGSWDAALRGIDVAYVVAPSARRLVLGSGPAKTGSGSQPRPTTSHHSPHLTEGLR